MKEKAITYRFIHVILLLLLGIVSMFIITPQVRGEVQLLAHSEPPPETETLTGTVFSAQITLLQKSLSEPALNAAIEVFDNTWSYSTLGLVYDPGRDSLRYAHESQSNVNNPTIYEVDYTVPHTLGSSIALSAVNVGWPWQIDNRDGVGYDFAQDTYFLPDYEGDLSYADDNIVEIDASGTILNAWEMDNEVGSNDSSDGSAIDSIIDIAVVPGNPTRYFVTASYDGAVVYEIALTKTGVWWTPNSWYTIDTYTLPILSDNLGIDWDAEHEVLFHSDWNSTTILITDLAMNPIEEIPATFDCPGAGGYNSGVTFIEWSNPTEVWVTDFSSDKTTRCRTPFEVPPPAWEKLINTLPWHQDFTINVETGDTIVVEDILTPETGNPGGYTLIEEWNNEEIGLISWDVNPTGYTPYASNPSPEVLFLEVPPGVDFGPVTITKWFAVQSCNWLETFLFETLHAGGEIIDKPVIIHKEQPQLWIDSIFNGNVFSGMGAEFELLYGNAGGFESNAYIRSEFPTEAPFIESVPPPDDVDTNGLWAEWNLGSLGTDDSGNITVIVEIAPDLPIPSTIEIWNGILDHDFILDDEILITFHTPEVYLPLILRSASP